jgi:hypothetical protein
VQVFADGAFHVLMYGLAVIGVALLWARRLQLSTEGTARRFIGAVVLGFGAWNVVDAVLFHWVLRIHHIRLEPEAALVSDILWLVALGLVPLLVGWRLWRTNGGGTPATASSLLVVLVLVGAAAASLAPRNDPMTAVLFRPGLSDIDVLNAVAAVDGRLAWTDRTGRVVVIALEDQAARWRLYRHGAILVGGAGPAGCLAWARA